LSGSERPRLKPRTPDGAPAEILLYYYDNIKTARAAVSGARA